MSVDIHAFMSHLREHNADQLRHIGREGDDVAADVLLVARGLCSDPAQPCDACVNQVFCVASLLMLLCNWERRPSSGNEKPQAAE